MRKHRSRKGGGWWHTLKAHANGLRRKTIGSPIAAMRRKYARWNESRSANMHNKDGSKSRYWHGGRR